MKYELMMILDPKKTDKEMLKLTDELKGHLSANGFSMLQEDVWGNRQLAYKIKGYSTGHYIVWLFEGEGAGTIQLNKDLRIQSGLIRYMLVKVADDHVLMRYEEPTLPGAKQKLSQHAEELSRKVSGKGAVTAKELEHSQEPDSEEEKKRLDDQLKAIMDDTDLNI